MTLFRLKVIVSKGNEAPFASLYFFFNDTATTEIYTLSLHDALPISSIDPLRIAASQTKVPPMFSRRSTLQFAASSFCASSSPRSEEHTSELQSRQYLVCRLLLEKKKRNHARSLVVCCGSYIEITAHL